MRESLDFTQMPKVAFINFGTAKRLLAPIKRFAGNSSVGRLLGSSNNNPVIRGLMPYGDKAEKLLVQGAGHFLSPERTQSLAQAVKGISRPMVRDAWSNAVIGGGLSGGLNAAFAEKGERGKAFLQGAASGAGLGAVSGAVQGASTGIFKNLRAKNIMNMANTHGVMPGTLGKDIYKQNMFWGKGNALRGAFGKEDSLHRQASRAKLVGGMATGVGAGFILPTAAEMAVSRPVPPPPPPPPPPAPVQPPLLANTPAVYYAKQGSAVLTRPDFIQLLGRA